MARMGYGWHGFLIRGDGLSPIREIRCRFVSSVAEALDCMTIPRAKDATAAKEWQ
jgi:hypothetical protein